MLRPCAVTVFVRPDTIEKVERYFAEDSDVFAARTEIVEDHRGESGTLCRLLTAGAEVELAPFNDFHYRSDFEIGLTIAANHSIHDLEGALANHGYDFESGFFDDEHREYFLIPRKQGVFTPFAVASYQNTQSNPYLDSVRRIRVELPRESVATTDDFVRRMSIRDHLDIEIAVGPKRRFISALFDIGASTRTELDLRFDSLHVLVKNGEWLFSVSE